MVTAIAAISLVVAGVLIMNITLISVSQRQSEIGLLKALGASSTVIRNLFLAEILLLSLLSIATAHLLVGSVIWLVKQFYPVFPLTVPYWASLLATAVTLIIATIFTWAPAQKAARLPPMLALTNRVGED